MHSIALNGLPEEVHQALKLRARRHGRSMEAELMEILIRAVSPRSSVKLGDLLADISQHVQLSDDEAALLEGALLDSDARFVSFD